jgi:anionic cell wall polymer biosynthesis LytR-Cps2A-Psr (LCP) family protein
VSTVVTIMDRAGWDQCTDVIVAVLPERRTLLWVPRDLLSTGYGCRINGVFAREGHDGLRSALREYGVEVEHSACIQRGLSEELLAGVSVEVPVDRPLEYWYPDDPHGLLQDGKHVVRFDPPSERLEGHRLHEWIGARVAVDRYAGDLERIRRQHVFVRSLLRSGFDPRPILSRRRELWTATPGAAEDLQRVTADWRMELIDDVEDAMFGEQQVLVLRGARA